MKEPIDYFFDIITYPLKLIDESGLPRFFRFILSFPAILIVMPIYIPLFLFFGIWEFWNLTK